jgi:hypothetical protein
MDETKTIKASDIVSESDQIHFLQNMYILITDTSLNMTFTNFIAAVNILAEAGWEIGNPTISTNYIFAMCKNPHAKRKNEMLHE